MVHLVEWYSMMHWDRWAVTNLSVEKVERDSNRLQSSLPNMWEAFDENLIAWIWSCTVSVKTWVLFPVKFYFILNLIVKQRCFLYPICVGPHFSACDFSKVPVRPWNTPEGSAKGDRNSLVTTGHMIAV